MPFLDYNDVRNIGFEKAVAPQSLGPRASFGEAFSAGMEATVLGQIAPSEVIARRRATLENMQALKKYAGDTFPNLGEDLAREVARVPGTSPDLNEAYETAVQARVRQVLDQRPDLADRFNADIQTRAYEMTREAEEKAQEVAQRSGIVGQSGALAGSLAAFIYDPVTYAGLLVGGAPTAGRSLFGAVAVTAAREGAIGAVGEAAAQPIVQEYRVRAGLDAGFWLGVQNAVLAGVASATLSGIVKGATAGGKRLYEVAGEVMYRYRTDPEFRKGLTPTEREALAANDRDAAEMASAPYKTDTVPDADAVRAAIAEATESLQAGVPLRRMDLDPLAAKAGYRAPDIPLRTLMGDLVDEATLREMETVQRGMRVSVASERALLIDEVQAAARGVGLVARQADELTRAQQARIAVDDELEVVNAAINRLRRGELPDDTTPLAQMLDPATAGRLEQIATELQTKGLSRKARERLEAEQEMLVRSTADEALPQLERRADDLARVRTERVSEEQGLRDALRALRRGKDPASRRRAADTKARHKRVLDGGRAPEPADIADFPDAPTPYRAKRIAEVEQHTEAAEARVNNEEATAQRAESRVAQEVEAVPDRSIVWGGEAKTLRAVQDELDRQQSLADMIKECRGG